MAENLEYERLKNHCYLCFSLFHDQRSCPHILPAVEGIGESPSVAELVNRYITIDNSLEPQDSAASVTPHNNNHHESKLRRTRDDQPQLQFSQRRDRHGNLFGPRIQTPLTTANQIRHSQTQNPCLNETYKFQRDQNENNLRKAADKTLHITAHHKTRESIQQINRKDFGLYKEFPLKRQRQTFFPEHDPRDRWNKYNRRSPDKYQKIRKDSRDRRVNEYKTDLPSPQRHRSFKYIRPSSPLPKARAHQQNRLPPPPKSPPPRSPLPKRHRSSPPPKWWRENTPSGDTLFPEKEPRHDR